MRFCKGRVHSLSFSTADYSIPPPPPPSLLHGGLGLITASAAAEETHLHHPYSNLLDSTALKSKRDPGGIGFVDEVGGCVNGLTSCTESLGFESSDERQPEAGGADGGEVSPPSRAPSRPERAWKVASADETKRSDRKYPPPLTSMRRDGQRSFILRPVRRDGRLELREVSISRPPEILEASREDGRLRLRLIIGAQEEGDDADDSNVNTTTSSESENKCHEEGNDDGGGGER